MQLTTMEVLEARKAELQKSKMLTTAERDAALLANARDRSILEMLEVRSLEEAEDVVCHLQTKAAETDRLEREIEAVQAEIEAGRILLEEMRKHANND